MQREPIASIAGVTIIYTGPRLDQSDLDVWEGALHLARHTPLGARVAFTERGFLRSIGRGGENGKSTGKSDREWLKNAFARLSATTVEISQGQYSYAGSLVEEYLRDDSTRRYFLMLNPRMKVMFSRDGYTQVEWRIRQALRGHPLAQWLHGFYSSHADPFPLKVETLHRLCGSETGHGATTTSQKNKALLDWRDDSLLPALVALEHASTQAARSFSWEVGADGLVRVKRGTVRMPSRQSSNSASIQSVSQGG